MTNSTTSKFVAAAVGFALALTVFVGVGASTAGAQAMTLSQLVDLFISLGIISPDKAAAAKAAVTSSVTAAPAYTFTTDLTVGSKGDAVTALQNAVGVTPATGYFGAVTKAAVQKFQTANGINATGYVGALTRAALNKAAAPSTTTTTTTTTTTGTTPVVNSGVEGTLTATKASVSNSTVYEGDTMHTVLGIKLEARISDINVQRVRLDLGASTNVYTKTFKTAYLTDDSGKVLVQADLNSNTVVKDGSSYILTLGGFNYTVPKDVTKYIWVKMDAYSTFKTGTSGVNCSGIGQTCTIKLAATDPVRGTDGAGFDQYSGDSSVSQNLTLTSSLVDSATVDVSLNSANYKTGDVVASNGANNDELDQLNLLAVDFRANKDNVKITDLTFTVNNTSNNPATTTTAYLYDGSTLIQSESVIGSSVAFTDIDNLWVNKDATKTLTLKADVRNAVATSSALSASIVAAGVTAENSQGSSAGANGSATGENMYVRNVGPLFALNGITVGTVAKNTDQSGNATSTLPVTFNLQITAKGGDISFGAASSTAGLALASIASSTQIDLYKDGAATLVSAAPEVSNAQVVYDVPSSGVVTSGNLFTLSKNNIVTIPVQVKITVAGASAGAHSYALGLKGLNWGVSGAATTTSTFMSGRTEWRSSAVALP